MKTDLLRPPSGVLFSGGLDSAVLTAHLGTVCQRVQPIYVAQGLVWEAAELAHAREFLARLAAPRVNPLVVLELPLGDLYQDHWSFTGQGIPSSETPDEAVYLPGRNPLLIIKARLWCQLNGIGQLALGSLASNPFADATDAFFAQFEAVLDQALEGRVALARPFADADKAQVIAAGLKLPLELTFSCLAPRGGLHCGVCNKCAERQRVFAQLQVADPTRYFHTDHMLERPGRCFE